MSAKPFVVETELTWTPGYREYARKEWQVRRGGWIIARCSSERYARRIACLLNADEARP